LPLRSGSLLPLLQRPMFQPALPGKPWSEPTLLPGVRYGAGNCDKTSLAPTER